MEIFGKWNKGRGDIVSGVMMRERSEYMLISTRESVNIGYTKAIQNCYNKNAMEDIARDHNGKPIKLGSKQAFSKNPKTINLRQKNIPESLTNPNLVIDIVGKKEESLFIPEKKKRKFLPPLFAIGLLGMTIVFFINIAGTLSKGQKLFSQVSYSAGSALQDIIAGGKKIAQGKTVFAKNYFEQAANDFEKIDSEIWFFRTDEKLKSLTGIVEAGTSLSEAGKLISDLAENFKDFGNLLTAAQNTTEGGAQNLIMEKIRNAEKIVPEVSEKIKNAISAFEKLDQSLIPEQWKEKFRSGLFILKNVDKKIDRIINLLPGLIKILGAQEENPGSDFIVLLQNSDEMRPSGGFIGSYLKVRMSSGALTEFNLEDVYDIDDGFKEVIEPPQEIKKLTDRWFFRDSNYHGDFRVSGKKALELYEKEYSEALLRSAEMPKSPFDENEISRDNFEQSPAVRDFQRLPQRFPKTILAVNHNLLGRLLEVTGPIEIEGLSLPFTAENYRHVLTYMIESKIEGMEDPKKVLKKFAPIFQKRLFQKMNAKKVQQIVLEEMTKKNILGFSHDEDIQKFFEELGINGDFEDTQENEDYLAIILSSFSGNKSDAFMKQEIQHDTIFGENGEILDQLAITREHTWNEKTFSEIRTILWPFGFKDFPPHILDVLGQGDNKQAVRIYVLEGSILQSVEGIGLEKVATHIDSENGKTYFAFDFITKSGQKKSITIRYRLPFSVVADPTAEYRFTAQKQPGMPAYKMKKNIFRNAKIKLTKKFPDIKSDDTGNIAHEFTMEKDVSLATLWIK